MRNDQLADYSEMQRRYAMFKNQTLRAKGPDGRWLHLDAIQFTKDRNQRWLGTPQQFKNVNEWYHGGQLTAVNRFDEKDEPRFSTTIMGTGKERDKMRRNFK